MARRTVRGSPQKVRLLGTMESTNQDALDRAVLTHGSSLWRLSSPKRSTGGVDEASHFGLRVAVHATPRRESETRFSRRSFGGARRTARRRPHRDGQTNGTYSTWISMTKNVSGRSRNRTDAADFLQHDADLDESSARISQSRARRLKMRLEPMRRLRLRHQWQAIRLMVKYGMTPCRRFKPQLQCADLLGHASELDRSSPASTHLVAVTEILERHQRIETSSLS